MKHTNKRKSSSHAATIPPASLEDQIRCRAYDLYQERGRGDGHDLEDWLEAENEIAGKASSRIAAA